MEYSELLKSGIGAVLGFMLAQFVNFSKIIYDKIVHAKLNIEFLNENGKILSHDTEIGNGQTAKEIVYGFRVCNVGKRVATGVRFSLIKLEYKINNGDFRIILESSHDLHIFSNSRIRSNEFSATLVPGSSVLIELSRWREDWGVIIPSIPSVPDYYEETSIGSDESRFTVVCFDDKGRYKSGKFTIPH